MATNLPFIFFIQFLEQLLKFLANFTLLKYVKSQRRYGFLITKKLIFGFQILDLKVHFSASLKISTLVLESNDKILSVSRQIIDGEAFLEGRPKDFSDFQSSLGFPIFSFSFPTTNVFFLLLIKYCILLRAFCNFHDQCSFLTFLNLTSNLSRVSISASNQSCK